ncbi:MAG: alpha/beta hydrolase [Pseudomonadota bacterium]
MERFPEARRLNCGAVHLATYSEGEGPPVIFCHGFPELAYSWRYQLPAIAEAGFHAIAPDMRGYGASDKPSGVEHYDIFHLMSDLDGLLDAIGETSAYWVGHDWGALLLWQYALMRPEKMRGLIALNIPFAPRRTVDPMVMTREVLGDDFYIVNFQDSHEADDAFDADPERFLRAMYRRLPATRAQFNATDPAARQPFSMLREMRKETFPGQALMSDDDLAIYVDAFRSGGFTAPINWYRNWSRNWRETADVVQKVTTPTLFIGAEDDILIAPEHIETMRRYVDPLDVSMIKNCGHWTQQEHPERVNALIVEWLQAH